jgi:bacterioferritin (cytochrome b1)
LRRGGRLCDDEASETLLTDEAGHIDFLETQIDLIDKLGA